MADIFKAIGSVFKPKKYGGYGKGALKRGRVKMKKKKTPFSLFVGKKKKKKATIKSPRYF